MALLFDSPGNLCDIRYSSFDTPSSTSLHDDLIVAVAKSIVRINPHTCEILQTINVSSQMKDVVAAVALPDRATLVALADSSCYSKRSLMSKVHFHRLT